MLTAKSDIDNSFKIQKESFLNEDASSLKDRIKDLNVIKKALLKYQHELSSAMNEDFGNRNEMDIVKRYTAIDEDAFIALSKNFTGLVFFKPPRFNYTFNSIYNS